MKKKLLSVSIVLSLFISVLLIQPVQGGINSAVTYLKTKPVNPWITMALVANGESPNVDYLKSITGNSATDYEAPILALVAAGKNPRTFPDTDLVAALKTFHTGGQIGSSSTLNDDVFGILALLAAGESLNDPVVASAKEFILDSQNADGGWPFAVGGSSDTNMTSMAIMALLEADISKNDSGIINAINYLKSAQNDDGGFPYDPVSPWGTGSDASSDAWVISAINKLGENPADWTKNGHNPIEHLLSLQTSSGYFEYQTGTGEDSFSSVTTSYAVIALSGGYYPVNSMAQTIPVAGYKIEGSSGVICEGESNASNPLVLVENVAGTCGFTYHITETSFGPYLDRIGDDAAEGVMGWLYAVNFVLPSVGAVDYELQGGDYVVWHYGSFDWLPQGTEVNLSANILDGGDDGSSGDGEEVSFSVSVQGGGSDLNFGDVTPGTPKSNTITITNQGQIGLYIESVVTGDDVFRNYLEIDNVSWRDFNTSLQVGDSKDAEVSLGIPASYSNAGSKNGKLIFWAIPN